MSKITFKRCVCAFFAAIMAMIIFTLSASANTRIRPSNKREAEASDNMSGMTTNTPSAADSAMPDDNTVGTAPGTGEFGDDTSDTSSDATDTSADSTSDTTDTDTTRHDETGNLESSLDGVINDTENTVDDMTNGIGVWGVVIVIAIIAAIAILIFAFFSKRK